MKYGYSVLFTFILLVNGAIPAAGQTAPAGNEEIKRMSAFRITSQISVDGRLDEAAWREASPATGFRQFEPSEGAAATQSTEARVLYGAENLYVGLMLYDENPAQIAQTLGRRDNFNRADWVLVSIDSYFDRRTAYLFGINAAGVQYDAVRSGGGGRGGPGGRGGRGGPGDNSWDAVWYSDVSVTPDGWSVEMRIPYSMLRFSEAETQTWGIHFTRRIPRLGERVEWPLVPRAERSNLVAQFGQLTGITGVDPRRNVQVRPYTVARVRTREEAIGTGVRRTEGSFDVGGDVKVGLGPNVTLDATVNPDFGQVEADPAVLNLTAFETNLRERRPFFVEGAQIYEFDMGRDNLLYTRRIGAHAPIVGALKLSGRTAGGLSFGVLGASTGENFSPNRHYGVTRLTQQIGSYSSLGGIVTAFDGPGNASGRHRSVVGGSDWDVRFGGNEYGLEGYAVVSHRAEGTEPDAEGSTTGLAANLELRKRQGNWQGNLGADVLSERFDPNDVGQLRRANRVGLMGRIERELSDGQPFGPFQRGNVNAFAFQNFSYRGGLNLGQRIGINSRWVLRSFQSIRLSADLDNPWGGYDLYETRGLYPWAEPSGVEVEASFETDERRRWRFEPEFSLTRNDQGGHAYEAGVRASWNLGARLDLSADLEGEWERGLTAWAANEALRYSGSGGGTWWIGREAGQPPDALTPDDYVAFDDNGELGTALTGIEPYGTGEALYYVPVFGARDTRSIDLTVRGTVTVRPNLSLELYSQLFTARGRYDRFRILQDRDTLVPFTAYPKRNAFAFSSLQSNVVLRWQYRPGSTLFFVWSHGRRADYEQNPLAPWKASPYVRSYGTQVDDALSAFPDNMFSIKLTYTFLN